MKRLGDSAEVKDTRSQRTRFLMSSCIQLRSIAKCYAPKSTYRHERKYKDTSTVPHIRSVYAWIYAVALGGSTFSNRISNASTVPQLLDKQMVRDMFGEEENCGTSYNH
jgi:hypothetical protein